MDATIANIVGQEAITALRSMSWTESIRSIALTASTNKDLHDAAIEAGADQVLLKPFDPDDFVTALDQQ